MQGRAGAAASGFVMGNDLATCCPEFGGQSGDRKQPDGLGHSLSTAQVSVGQLDDDVVRTAADTAGRHEQTMASQRGRPLAPGKAAAAAAEAHADAKATSS